MDILSPKGMETLQQEREAVDMFCRLYSCYSYVHTPKDQPCSVDGFLVRDSAVHATVEVKCRMMTLDEFTGRFQSRWLITHAKLERAAEIAGILCTPLIGFLYLVPSKTLLFRKLWHDGGFCVDMDVAETVTQKTVNGGVAKRLNAFVDMTGAKVITPPKS